LKKISSRANPSVKYALKLKTKKGRDRNNAFLAEGGILIEEAIKTGTTVRHVFLRDDAEASGVAEKILKELPADTEILLLPSEIFNEIADAKTPQALMAVVEKPENVRFSAEALTSLADGEKGSLSVIVLDRIRDPGNTGSILRTADAAGVTAAVLIKGTADIFAPKVCRAAAGALFRLPVFYAEDAESVIEVFRNSGISLFALDMDGIPYYEAGLTGKTAFIVGNEGEGLQDVFIKTADALLSVPMRENAESLNAGVAAAVIMYEKLRQDRQQGEIYGN